MARSSMLAEAEQHITAVTEEIKWFGVGGLDSPQRFWAGTGLDALILKPPDHSGRSKEVARQVYHRLSARFVAARAFEAQRLALKKGIAYAFFGSLALPVASLSAGVVGQAAFLLAPLVWLSLPVGLVLYARHVWTSAGETTVRLADPKVKEEALAAVRRCFLRAVPESAPEDLADVWRHGWLTQEGRPVSSEIVETDASSMEALATGAGWKSCYQALLLCAALCVVPGCSLLTLPLLFLLALRGENPGVTRAREMDRRRAVEGSVLAAAGGLDWSEGQERARLQQISGAMADTTPVLKLGLATGIFANRGDDFAPSRGLPFDLSLRDLQNHLVVFGGTGSGKTSGVLRPMAHQIASFEGVGLVVMDGKASLPAELRGLSGMRTIDPSTEVFSLVGGLEPAELVDTLVDVLATGKEAEPYWTNSAAGLLRRAAVIAKKAGGPWWSLSGIAKVAKSVDAMDEVKARLTPEDVESDPLLEDALFFFAHEWAEMDDRPRSSVLSHAMTWVSTITAHPHLLRWADALPDEDSFDLGSPLKGGRIGLLIPAHRYGRAGAAVTALLKARLYAGLKARADRGLLPGETPVVLLVDEAQEVATADDATMLAIGRSLGLAMVAATQTVEGVTDRLGQSTAARWLAAFGNAMALPGRSEATDTFVARRAGSVWKAAVRSAPGSAVRESIAASAFSGSLAAARRQGEMRRYAVAPPSPVAPFVEKARTSSGQGGQANPDPRYQREPDDGLSSSIEPVPLVRPEEVATLLAEPNTAVAACVRARVPRRDVVKLNPMY